MAKLKVILLSIILILSNLIIINNFNDNLAESYPGVGDWVITDHTYVKDENITLRGDLIVKAAGKLTLDNTTLIVKCIQDGQFKIEVQKDGELNIFNNSTIRSHNSTYRYDFYYLKDSKGTLSNSTIMNAGWDYFAGSHGLLLGSNYVVVDNCTFNYNYIDIWCEASTPLIKNNKIITKCIGEPGEHFQIGGICFWLNPNPIIINNYIY